MERQKSELPVKLANQAKNFFSDSFRKQGWEDRSVKSWKPRLREGRRNKGGLTLVQSGALKRAVNRSIRSQNFSLIRLAVALPYAAVHNDGYHGPVRKKSGAVYTMNMPQRKFMGDSFALRKKQVELINKSIKKAWQG